MNVIVISSSNLLRYPHSIAVGGRDIHPINWRKKYAGLMPSEMKRLRQLEDENNRLKKLLAEQMMVVPTLKEMLGKTSEVRIKTLCCDLVHD